MTVPTRRTLSPSRTWSTLAIGAALGFAAGFGPGAELTPAALGWQQPTRGNRTATSGADQPQQNAAFDQEQLLKDYIHYVLIARTDLARGSARALIDSGITPADLYRMIDELDVSDRLVDALDRSARIAELQEVAGQLQSMVRQGRIDVARDPNEIERHINNLDGSARARLMAREGLVAAGEYAVPQLLDVLRSSASVAKQSAVRAVLVEIGRQAVTPLTTILPHVDPVLQEQIALMLGQIGWDHAQPALLALIQNARTEPRVRQVAQQAYEQLGGSPSSSLVDLWVGLGEQYWAEYESLVAWPDEPMNNIWMYVPANLSLTMVPVPTEIFHEVMAMRTSENALRVAPDSDDALALWIASNFRRMDQLPADAEDATYGDDRRIPQYYAMAAGPRINQMVLGRAVADLNSELSRHAIEALRSTAGSVSLIMNESGGSPLVAAIDFPERRVRFEAALALAKALPTSSFPKADRVIPILAGAIIEGDATYAAVIADNDEDQRTLRSLLEEMGFTVIAPQPTFDALRPELVNMAGVDLFMVDLPVDEALQTVQQIRTSNWVTSAPVMLRVSSDDALGVQQAIEDDFRTDIVRTGVTETAMTAAVNSLVERTLGALITSEEAEQYSADALRTIRDVALSGSRVYNVADAESALTDAIYTFDGELRLLAGEALSWVNTPSAQQTLIAAALAEPDEFMQISFLTNVADSARRFGSAADRSQVAQLRELVQKSDGPVGTAAATAYGALNLPPSDLVPLVVVKDE